MYFHFKFHDVWFHFYWYAFGICNLGLVPMTSTEFPGASSETEKVTPRKGRGERNQQTAAFELTCVEGYCGDTDAI